MEDYGFEYSDDDAQDENVDIENTYYNSKGLLSDDDPREALKGFESVVGMETSKGDWWAGQGTDVVLLVCQNSA